MKHYILYGHGGSGNHGCEALVRTTIQLIGVDQENISLVSEKPDEDRKYGLNQLCKIVAKGEKVADIKKDYRFWKAYYQLKTKRNYKPMDILAELQAMKAKRNDIALSIGGDTYCYGKAGTNSLLHQHQMLREAGLKTVFWGCSIEEELLDDYEILEDIKSFDLITARESLSYKSLKKVNPNTILVADSAFILGSKKVIIPWNNKGRDYVGINVSPLVEGTGVSKEIVRKNYEKLIEDIISNTEYDVLLIPHVIWKHDDDREALKELYEQYQETNRVYLCNDSGCNDLKGIIAQCRFVICARTHVSIAAYSTGVPTIVLGYSTKSKGIAIDLFGDYKNYVIPVQELKTEEDLTDAWKWLQKNEAQIKDRLVSVMPDYMNRVYAGQKALWTL